MDEDRKTRFVSYKNWQSSMPVRWQGWLILIVFFAVSVFVAREMTGMVRATGLAIVGCVFTIFCWRRTRSITRTNASKNPFYWLFGGDIRR